MQVEITDAVNETIVPTQGEFDRLWVELGAEIKLQLLSFDPERTWLNLYLSHDGKPSFVRTIVRT